MVMQTLPVEYLPGRAGRADGWTGGWYRRAAVVGADGFIGRHLTAALRACGTEVSAYTRTNQPLWPDDRAAPGIVFYLASSVTPALAEKHPEWVTADHSRFTQLVRRLAASAQPPTVVLTSSAGTVYDPDALGRCGEDAPTRATSRYGAAKLALERLLLDHAGDLPAVVLRLSNVYGPGQRTDKAQGVLAHWLRAAALGEPLQLIGDGRTSRDYVYIDDVVDCMLRVAADQPVRVGAGPLVLNVASGVSTTLVDLLSIVETVVGRELPVRLLPHRSVDRRDTHLDVRLAARHLSWHARTELRDGVGAMWLDVAGAAHRADRAPAREEWSWTTAGTPTGTLDTNHSPLSGQSRRGIQ
jgi:UDP-glucose 4-epimerase